MREALLFFSSLDFEVELILPIATENGYRKI